MNKYNLASYIDMTKEKVRYAKKLTIKIGGDMDADEARIFNDPEYAKKPTNTLYLDNFEQLGRLLSPQKLSLLRVLIEHAEDPKTIGQIAAETKRKQEAISRDLHQLDSFGLVNLKKQKNSVYATATQKSIEIQFT